MRLWEYRDRIISGEFPELAPLLVLCEEEPTEETLQKEVELIHASGLSVDVQTDLMAVALLVASRTFGRAILETIFGQDLLHDSSFIRRADQALIQTLIRV